MMGDNWRIYGSPDHWYWHGFPCDKSGLPNILWETQAWRWEWIVSTKAFHSRSQRDNVDENGVIKIAAGFSMWHSEITERSLAVD